MFDLSLIQQYQKHFLNSCLCGPVLCGLQWKLQAYWSCLLELNGAFYIYPKYFPNIFIFYSATQGAKLSLFLWQRDLYWAERFCSPTPLVFKIAPREFWTLFLLCLPWSPCCGFPSGHTRHFVQTPFCHLPSLMPQPLLTLHVDMPSHLPWSSPLLMFQCHETSLDKPTRLVDKTHHNCGSSWLLSMLPVFHHGLVHSSPKLSQKIPFTFHP